MATKPETTNEIRVDPKALYLEEIFTDRRVGTIRRLTPVGKDGERDAARAVLYVGETQVLTPAGASVVLVQWGLSSLAENYRVTWRITGSAAEPASAKTRPKTTA